MLPGGTFGQAEADLVNYGWASVWLADDDDYSRLEENYSLPPALCGTVLENAFADAYIKPIVADHFANGSTLLGWNLNFPYSSASWVWGRDLVSAPDFWAVLVVSAFQAQADEDFDPDSTFAEAAYGISGRQIGVPVVDLNQCFIFLETINEHARRFYAGDPTKRDRLEEAIVAHEIGHTPGVLGNCWLLHMPESPGGLMIKRPDWTDTSFDGASIRIFRTVTVW